MNDSGVQPRGWLVVGLLWLPAWLNYMDRVIITTMHQSIVRAIPMDEAQFGLAVSAFLWVYAILSPVAGFMSDRHGRRWVVIGSLFVWSAATLLNAYVTTLHGLIAVRMLLGLGQAAYLPASLAMIAEYHRGRTRSLATGLHMAGVVAGHGFAGLGGWIADRWSWHAAFFGFGALGLVYCLLLVVLLQDAPGDGATSASESDAVPQFLPAVRSLFNSTGFLLALGFWTLQGISGWARTGWMPTYVQEHFHLGQGASGFIATSYSTGAAVIGMIIAGAWADRWIRTNPRSRISVSVVGTCIAAPAFLLSALTNNLSIAIAGFVISGFAGSFINSNLMPIVCMVADSRYRATAYGILNAMASLIGGLSIYAGGALKDAHIGLRTTFTIAAGALLLAALFLHLIKPSPETA